jgi:predicted nucleotidyltransferase
MARMTTPPSLNAVAQRLPAFCRHHGISRVEVFGSLARGEATESSDVDLMITFRPEVHPGLEFFSMQEELEELLGCKVDLVTRRAVERSENPIRQRSILESAREIYAG